MQALLLGARVTRVPEGVKSTVTRLKTMQKDARRQMYAVGGDTSELIILNARPVPNKQELEQSVS